VRSIAVDAVYTVILGIIVANGIPEAIVAGIFTVAIGSVIYVVLKKKTSGVSGY